MNKRMINAPVRRDLYLINGFWSSFTRLNFTYSSNQMAKSLSRAECVADRLTAINTAVEARFRHTTKAISIRDKATRTTPALLTCLQHQSVPKCSLPSKHNLGACHKGCLSALGLGHHLKRAKVPAGGINMVHPSEKHP